MSNIIIYSKDNCSYCDKAKVLMKIKNLAYTEIVIGKDLTREDFVSTFPDQKTVPLIIIDGVKIGGYTEFSEWVQAR